MELRPRDQRPRRDLKVSKDVNGVVVGRVEGDSPAGALGVQAGDVTVSVDQRPVATPEGAGSELRQAATRGNVLLLINWHGTSQFVGLPHENNRAAGSSH